MKRHGQKGDNKIGIPWYKRNVRLNMGEDSGITPLSFNSFDIPKPNSLRRVQPVRQPVRVPVTSPVTSPVLSPVPAPAPNPYPAPNPFPDMVPKPTPVPFPGARPTPLPERDPNNVPQGGINPPVGQPSFPMIPSFTDPNWAKSWENNIGNLTPAPTPAPVVKPKNGFEQTLQDVLSPVLALFIANEVKNEIVRVNITDPIYQQMLKDPTLGMVLREAEKADLDLAVVSTYLANYNWDKFDGSQMTKDLTKLIGAIGAARIMALIVGRKIAFRL